MVRSTEQNEPVDELSGDHGRSPSPARVPCRGATFRCKAIASRRHGATQAAWDTISRATPRRSNRTRKTTVIAQPILPRW